MSLTATLVISIADGFSISPSDIPVLLEELSDLSPILQDVVLPELQRSEEAAFATHGASIGAPWEGNDPRWTTWKGEHGYATEVMHMTGALADSIGQTGEVGDDFAFAGTNIPYAQKLQEGFSGRAPDGIYRNVPARIFMDLTDDELETICERVAQALASQAGIPVSAISVTVA